MKVLIINQSEVVQLLPMDECMDVMAEALRTLARGEAILPLRPVMWLPERVGALGMMPGYLGDIERMGLKIVSVFPGNHGTEYDSHIGAVLLYETNHGQLLSIMDASEITAIRTAAVSGVATRLLAREDAGDLAILGSGVQARSHLKAMRIARNIRQVRVWSRNPDHAQQFAERESQAHGIPVEPMFTVPRAGVDLDVRGERGTVARRGIVVGEVVDQLLDADGVLRRELAVGQELSDVAVRGRVHVDGEGRKRVLDGTAEGVLGDVVIRLGVVARFEDLGGNGHGPSGGELPRRRGAARGEDEGRKGEERKAEEPPGTARTISRTRRRGHGTGLREGRRTRIGAQVTGCLLDPAAG